MVFASCSGCDCRKCLYFWSGRCPCYDNIRAVEHPRKKKTGQHWTGWSNCETPGEQDHWCRGGRFTPQTGQCSKFVRYDESKTSVQECLKAVIQKFQDNYISCSLLDNFGCERCYREWEEKQKARQSIDRKHWRFFFFYIKEDR